MLPTLIALTAAFFFLITSSNALSIDTSAHHLARHHHLIAARQPQPAKRASVSAKCRKRNSTSVAPPPSTSAPANTPAAPAPAPAPTTSQAPATPPSTGGNGKVGLAWAYGDDPHLANFISWKTSAYVSCFLFFPPTRPLFFVAYIFSSIYTWNPTKPQNTHGLQFSPMLWGNNQLGSFENLVTAGYSNIAMGFNE